MNCHRKYSKRIAVADYINRIQTDTIKKIWNVSFITHSIGKIDKIPSMALP